MIDAMSTPETSISDILRDVTRKSDPPEESQLRGGPLLEEIVKLAAMTAGYYLAKTAGASSRSWCFHSRGSVPLRR
jgi:hypothetical protein